jgi:Kef-type K+ transport system membrane component KefB
VALIAALGLSLSSTAIALATLDERNLLQVDARRARPASPSCCSRTSPRSR